MIYFDAAYIAKCYLNEPGAERVREVAYGADGLASCELARLEFASILKRHVRERHVTRRFRRKQLQRDATVCRLVNRDRRSGPCQGA